MKFLIAFLTYLPSVLAAVKGIEEQIQAPGATKKEIVMGSIAAAATAGQTIPSAHVQAISSAVDYSVKIFNASGVFVKAPTK
jgi:hypothetical protein